MIHDGEVIRSTAKTWLDDLDADAQRQAEHHGPLRGPVTAGQRPWSIALDVVEAERQRLAA